MRKLIPLLAFLLALPIGASVPPDSIDTQSVDTTRIELKRTQRAKNWIVRFFKNFDEYDTNYIQPNYYNYTAMLQNTNFYQSFRLRAENEQGESQSITMAPSPTFKLGPYFGWRWIFLGYTFDINHLKRPAENTETSLSLYSSMLGVDLMYIRNTGDFTIRRTTGFSPETDEQVRGQHFDGMDAKTVGFNAYYVFNHRRFSYPAAFAQSTVQRRSAGSFILGLNYLHQSVDFDHTRLPEELLRPGQDGTSGLFEEMMVKSVDYNNYSLSVGYAYNWVFARNCLLSVSVAPSLGFKQAKGERIRGEQLWENVRNMSFNCISRIGLVWNNSHMFAGASFVNYLHDYKKKTFSMLNTVNYISLYAGFFFHRKSQYRGKKIPIL